MFVVHKFELNPYTKDLLSDMEPHFGYSGFGEFIFYRTYSRVKEDGGQENWNDVVVRVIEGTFSIRKDWYIKNHISWDEKRWQKIAKDMAISMFEMKWLPPGRGLFAMGTQFVYERGSMALYNCAATSIYAKYLDDDYAWMMDVLMQGVGTGFSPIREDDMKFKNPKGEFEYIIEDTREAWVEATKLLIQAFMYGASLPIFNYSQIRKAGLPIKGFGGISSGPAPLMYLHNWVKEACDRYMSDKYYDSVIFKTDIANQIGNCVVAGNCYVKGTLIHTSNGLIPIEAVTINHKVQTLNGYKKVLNNFKQGKQKVISIYLQNGKEIECTPNHKLAVLSSIYGDIDWIEAQYLDEDDILLLNHIPCGNEFNYNDIIEAYFYGVLNGDGCVHIGKNNRYLVQIIFSNNEIGNKSADKILNYFHKIGYKGKIISQKESKNFFYIAVNSKNLAKKLLPYKIPKQCPIILEKIYSGSIEVRAAYLAGVLDSDGTSDQYILCCSKWLPFLEELRKIAFSLGINTFIRIGKETYLKKTNRYYSPAHYLFIKGFSSRNLACELINKYSCKQLPKATLPKNDSFIPISFAESESNISKSQIGIYKSDRTSGSTITHKHLINLYPDFWKKVIPCQIEQIFDLEQEDEVYDLEVEDEHCYFAEGVLSHNSRRSAELASGLITDDVFVNLKNYERYPEREGYGWLSNNSVLLQKNSDFELLPKIAERIKDNAEPGIINLRNFPKGRIGKRDNIRKDRAKNLNPCGEICLESDFDIDGITRVREVCNLSETCPTLCSDPKEWLDACKFATLYCSTVSLLPTNQSSTNRVVARNRRIGVGIIDIMSWIHDLGMSKTIKYFRKGYKIIRKTNQLYNGEAGIPEAIRVTTVKPGGSVPKLPGLTSGIMYPNFQYMIRRVRVARNHPIAILLKEANIPYEADYFSQNTDVFSWPIETNPNIKTAGEVSIWEQASNLILLQREWADNSVSNTLMFRPKWVLNKIISHKNGDDNVDKELNDWLYENHNLDSHNDTIMKALQQYDCYKDENYKIHVKWSEDFEEMIEAKIYEFDPRHEEDSLEAVLAAIAPLIKTASIMPHTIKGVYRQMPEEGITKEEYELRLSRIKPIDWSKLSNSDGQDEKFCMGEACELIQE